MERLKVKELMRPLDNYETVSGDEYLKDVLNNFLNEKPQKDFKVVLVKENSEITGILSIGDILRVLKKLTRTYGKHEIFESTSLFSYGSDELIKRTERDLEIGFSLKIKDIMNREREKIGIEETGQTALNILMENNRRVLIVCEEERIVGILNDVDLLRSIVELWKQGR